MIILVIEALSKKALISNVKDHILAHKWKNEAQNDFRLSESPYQFKYNLQLLKLAVTDCLYLCFTSWVTEATERFGTNQQR